MKTMQNLLRKITSSIRAAIIPLALLAAAPMLSAQTTYTWTGADATDSSNWGVSANWDSAPTFNTSAVLNFNTDIGNDLLTYLGAQRQIRGMEFGPNATTDDGVFRIRTRTTAGGTTGVNLLFNNGGSGGNAFITVDANTAADRIMFSQGNVGVVAIQTNTDFTHNSTSTLVEFDGTVTGAGAINKYGVGTATFTRGNSFDGLNIFGGSVVAWASSTALGGGSLTLGETASANDASLFVGSDLTYANNITVNSGNGVRRIGNTDVDTQTGLGAITGNAQLSGTIDLSAGKDVTFDIANYVAATTDRLTAAGVISGTGGIVKTGDGILLLNNANTYSGTTDIQSGKLFISTAGTLGTGNVTIASGANLDLNATGPYEMTNDISGDGEIIMTGGDTRITGDVTNTGGLTINSGTFRIGNAGTTGSYTGDTVINGGALAFARSNAYTHGGTISGAGGVSKVNDGVVTVTGDNSYSGLTQLFTGVLVADHANALGTGNITFSNLGGNTGAIRYTAASAGTDWATRIVNSAGTIRLDTNGNDVNLAGAINDTNTFGLVKSGAGVLTLGGNNTYTGATTVSAGTLLINGSTASGSAVTVANTAVIAGDGTINGNLTLQSGARFGFDTTNTAFTLTLVGTLSIDSGFGVGSLRNLDGTAIAWDTIALNTTYTLLDTSFTFNDTNIQNFGFANRATGLAGGREAYFQNGSLQLVVVPEPTTWALLAGSLTLLVLLRRRRGTC